MGKGSNVQKATQARERNLKKMGKSEEERKAASAKSKADANAYMCLVCRQTFMANARDAMLYQHVRAKHPADTDPVSCFPRLKDFDPEDPNGEKKAATATTTAGPPKPKKIVKKADADLDALLDAGVKKGKK
jgi:Zinc-binding